jgi:cyclophilin family peptidyl-prolyl cis-trans isomerase
MKRLSLLVAALCVATVAIAADAPKKSTADAPKRSTADAPKKSTAAPAQVKDSAMQQIDQFIATAKIDKTKPNWKTTLPKPTMATFDANHKYFVRVVTTKGTVLIQFMPDVAPMHVTNFVYLTKLGYYDGLSFHRVIPNFMAQGGCPLGTGTGGPGYGFNGEFSPNAKHDVPGVLSMANAGPGTDGSQFFLTFVPTPHLNGMHTVFGKVVEGLDVLKKLEACGTQSGRTSEPVKMEKVTVEVK